MHLIVPFAATDSPEGQAALAQLATPALDALLAHCEQTARDDGDALSLNPPHERALARAMGWPARPDGTLPWAANAARNDGLDVGSTAWGLLTPGHWRVGSDAIVLADPRTLGLDEAGSRALFDAVRPLFDSEGYAMHWGAPLRWYLSHAELAGLATASPDRVIGRNVDRWLPAQPEARRLRRLQNEVQMLLHTHPVNAQREAAGQAVVNSVWLSGCGALLQPRLHDAQVDERLAAPALAGDWAAWAAAWTALDASLLPTRPLRAITLCGERAALTFERREQRLWQRAASALRGRPPAREWLRTL